VHLRFKEIEGEVFVFNTHFPPAMKEPEKVRLCQFVSNCINKTAGEHSWAIVTGDLNIHDNDSSGIQILREQAQLSDPWTDTGTSQKYTWNFWFQPTWSGYTVDWILYRRPLRAVSVERPAYNENRQYPSDHIPVYASLTLSATAVSPVTRQE
jgi:endonuclease/exonuclease/phosphatase family metal-dependent hydrolase